MHDIVIDTMLMMMMMIMDGDACDAAYDDNVDTYDDNHEQQW